MFDERELLLRNVRYIPKFKQSLSFISMFNDLGYCTRIEREVLKISHGASIMDTRSKMYRLYILDGHVVIGHVLVDSKDFLINLNKVSEGVNN